MTMNQASSKTEKRKSKQPPRPGSASDDARVWVRDNHYDKITNLIDGVMETWKREGKRTRRNWWEILAGNPDGTPRIAGGREFPILRAARHRQGLPDVPHAIQLSPDEVPPPVRTLSRRTKRRRRARTLNKSHR